MAGLIENKATLASIAGAGLAPGLNLVSRIRLKNTINYMICERSPNISMLSALAAKSKTLVRTTAINIYKLHQIKYRQGSGIHLLTLAPREFGHSMFQ